MSPTLPNRWIIAAAGVVMQIALGAIYAWSVFRTPLIDAFGWTISEVTLTFTIAIFVIGFATFGGGLWMRRAGPRTVALAAGVLYGLGIILASFTNGRLWWLYLSYGLLGGVGLGLGYIVPVATLVKWFPDKRGMITGLAVAGFGAGALITAPIATRLIGTIGVLDTFAALGVVYLVMVPRRRAVHAGSATRVHASRVGAAGREPSAACERLHARQRSPELAVVRSLGTPVPQHDCGHCDHFASGADGTGDHERERRGRRRHGWAHLHRKWYRSSCFGRGCPISSDVGTCSLSCSCCRPSFFFFLPSARSLPAFAVLALIVLLCYGGGFGTMPAFVADYFGTEHVGSIYGLDADGVELRRSAGSDLDGIVTREHRELQSGDVSHRRPHASKRRHSTPPFGTARP